VSLISLIVVLAVVGFLLWMIQTYIPMSPPFKNVITVIVVLVLVLWLLSVFGIVGPTVPRLR
jgi:hypothetical protein